MSVTAHELFTCVREVEGKRWHSWGGGGGKGKTWWWRGVMEGKRSVSFCYFFGHRKRSLKASYHWRTWRYAIVLPFRVQRRRQVSFDVQGVACICVQQ